MALSKEDKAWLIGKFKDLHEQINNVEIKADKSLALARAVSKKVLD